MVSNKTALAISPNPAVNRASIKFEVEKSSAVQLKVFNLKGELVKTLTDGRMSRGLHQADWDGTDNREAGVSQGLYIVVFETSEKRMSRKVYLVR